MTLYAELALDGNRYELRRGAGENVTLVGNGWRTDLPMPWFVPVGGALWPEGNHLRIVASGFHCKDDHVEEFTWRVSGHGKLLRDESRAELAHNGRVYSVAPAEHQLILRGGQESCWERTLETPGHRPGWPTVGLEGHDLRVWVTAVDNRQPRCSVFRWLIGIDGTVRETTRGDLSQDLLSAWRQVPNPDEILAVIRPIAESMCAKDTGYPGGPQRAPQIEVFAAFADRWQMTVHFLCHHRRWCLAQSGSDFDMFYAHAGRARLVGSKLIEHSLGTGLEELITEDASEHFNGEAAAARVRARFVAELRLPW